MRTSSSSLAAALLAVVLTFAAFQQAVAVPAAGVLPVGAPALA